MLFCVINFVMNIIGKKIKYYWQVKGWSQVKLVEVCGWVLQFCVGNYELDW